MKTLGAEFSVTRREANEALLKNYLGFVRGPIGALHTIANTWRNG